MAESSVGDSIQDRGAILSDPLRGYRFRAVFTPVGGNGFDSNAFSFTGGFSSISGMGVTIAVSEYREGGYNTTTHKIPGMATFSPVTFSRGAIHGNDAAITWMRGLFAATAGHGIDLTSASGTNGYSKDASFRCNVIVYLNDHPNTGSNNTSARMAFYLHNAWISSLQYGGFEATANQLMSETMTLEVEGITIGFVQEDANGIISWTASDGSSNWPSLVSGNPAKPSA